MSKGVTKMRALRFGLVLIVALSALLWLSNPALARTHVSIGVGIGYPSFYYGWHHYPYYGPWGWRHHHPFIGGVIVGGWPGYYYGPDYVIVDPPPAVIERPVVVVQPKTNNNENQAFFEQLRNKKAALLEQLQTGDKEHRLAAIDELAGFSFDNNVRLALENVLLTDPDAELRIEVAQAFGEVKNAKALPALEKARVVDSNQDVRTEADQAIKNLENK
jgi:hypothetical protein